METVRFRVLDQSTVDRVLELADAAGISREAIRVPLTGEGGGRIERRAGGAWWIVLPSTGRLEPFLERVAAAFRGEPLEADPPGPGA
jgi:hypothetical protein